MTARSATLKPKPSGTQSGLVELVAPQGTKKSPSVLVRQQRFNIGCQLGHLSLSQMSECSIVTWEFDPVCLGFNGSVYLCGFCQPHGRLCGKNVSSFVCETPDSHFFSTVGLFCHVSLFIHSEGFYCFGICEKILLRAD